MQNLIFPVLIVGMVLILFLSTRKQKKMQAAQQDLQKSIRVGDRVMTTSGLYGTVAGTADETIDIEIAPGMVTTWLRAAVREKVDMAGADHVEGTETVEPESTEASDTNGSALSGTAVGADKASSEAGAELAPPLEHGKKSS